MSYYGEIVLPQRSILKGPCPGPLHAVKIGEFASCSEFAHEGIVSVSELLLSCVVAKLLSPRTLEELP